MISSEEAQLLMNKWRIESVPMAFILVGDGVGFSFRGWVGEVRSDAVQLRGEGSELLASLVGARFEYGDPREAPEGIRESSGKKFAGCLSVLLSGGDRLLLFERRGD